MITEGGIIRTGFDETLDKYVGFSEKGLAGLLRLRLRSEKTLVLAHLRLSIIKRTATISM